MAKAKGVKYADLINQSDDQTAQEDLALTVQESKSALEVDIAKTNSDIAKKEQELVKAKRAVPYSVHREIEVMGEIAGMKTGLEFAQSVLATRF